MKKNTLSILLILFITSSCYKNQKNCSHFKTGTFQFNFEINGQKKTSLFERTSTTEIDYFEGKTDTSSIRWINDCEYILEKRHPKNMREEKAIHVKILSTTEKTYTFEFSNVGNSQKQKGTITKIN